MIRPKTLVTGGALTLVGTVLLIAVLGLAQNPDSEPGAAVTALSWVLGTVVRAGGGYVAARMSMRAGTVVRVAGAGAIAGAAGYVLFFLLMASLAGQVGFSVGDVLGLPVWTAQAAVGGALAALLHRKRIRSEAETSSWAYG